MSRADALPASVVPRVLNAAGVARRLGKNSASWFYAHRAELEAQGFPPQLKIINGWDSVAVDAWLQQQNPKPTSAAARPAGGKRWEAAASG